MTPEAKGKESHPWFLCVIVPIALLFGAGCIPSPFVVSRAQHIQRDTQLSCPAAETDRCAIDSQFQTLADEAFASSDELHYVCLLDAGEDELLARINMIRSARESIVLQTFIYDDDEVGHLLFMELLGAAQRGVHVRIIIDQFGTYMTPRVVAAMAIAHENLDIALFSPVWNRGGKSASREIGSFILDMRTLNKRMHNKLMAVDERIGLVGGRNIQDSYYDYGDDVNFKDLGILVAGPIVEKMYESFDNFWEHKKTVPALKLPDVASAALKAEPGDVGMFLKDPELSQLSWIDETADAYSIVDKNPRLTIHSVQHIEYISDWPVKKKRTKEAKQWDSSERINQIVLSAEESLIMQTPYLIHDLNGIKNFRNFRKNNPQVDIALSTNSLASTDMFYVYAISFKQRQYYLEGLGARLYEFKPVPGEVLDIIPRYAQIQADQYKNEVDLNEHPDLIVPLEYDGPRLCIHSKYFIVDDYVLYVGSHNFDPRAHNLNTENGVLIWDQELALELRGVFERDTAPANSWVTAWKPKVMVVGNISDTIAYISSALPLFDLWPFDYSSNFNLKEEKEPLLPSEPDFYDHYRNVGPFPETGLSPNRLGVRFVRAFGGLARGIM